MVKKTVSHYCPFKGSLTNTPARTYLPLSGINAIFKKKICAHLLKIYAEQTAVSDRQVEGLNLTNRRKKPSTETSSHIPVFQIMSHVQKKKNVYRDFLPQASIPNHVTCLEKKPFTETSFHKPVFRIMPFWYGSGSLDLYTR